MSHFLVQQTPIEGTCVIEPTVYKDKRGYFMEVYNQQEYDRLGLNMRFVQDNQSMSTKGVLRGLHYQRKHPQGKLISVVMGCVFDVAVDIRFDSSTFGMWYGTELSDENKKQMYISEGLAHGFLVLSEQAVLRYKCTDFYNPEDAEGIAWNDPEIGIQWPLVTGDYPGDAKAIGYHFQDSGKINLSVQDQNLPKFSHIFHD